MTSPADDLEAIRHTLSTYSVNGDRLKLEALAGAFTEDGVLETPSSTLRGRAEIIAGLGGGERNAPPPGQRRLTFIRHNLTTSHLELTGPDTASGRTYFIVFTDIGPDHMGYYVDRLVKQDGQWLLAHRRVMIDWMSDESLMHGQRESYEASRAALLARRSA